MFKRNSIGFRIALPLTLCYVAISASVLLVLRSFTLKIYKNSFINSAKRSKDQVVSYISRSSNIAMNTAYMFSHMPSVVKSCELYRSFVEEAGVDPKDAIRRVKAFLLMGIGPVLKSVKSPFSPGSSLMLRFYLSDGRVLYSTWEKAGTPSNVFPLVCRGGHVIGLDAEGSLLFVKALAPVVDDDGRCLGAVESVFPLKDIASGIKLSKGELVLFYIATGQDKKGFKKVFGLTNKVSLGSIESELLERATRESFFERIGSKYVFFFPLLGEAGKVVGVGVYGLDSRFYLKEIGRNMLIIGFVVSTFFVALVFVLLLLVRTVTSPINSMVSVVNTLVDEGVGKGKRVESSGCEEINNLSDAINRLLDHMEELSLFKRVIEEDESLGDVYRRLSKLIGEKFSIPNFTIYEVNNSKNYMRIVGEGGEGSWCDKDILTEANLCRAKRTASIVSSLLVPDICPRFKGEGMCHICIPIYMGEQVGMVVQLVGKREDMEAIGKKLGRLRLYLRESSPVISSKRLLSALKESTTRDPLTGLFNRRFLEDYLETAVSYALRRRSFLGILMIDVDHFKEINDKYGHETGDTVLKEVAKAILSAVRKSDVLVRFGGEEFLLILNDVKPEHVMEVAEKVRKKVEMLKIPISSGAVIRRTVSIGVSVFPIDSEDIWECIKFSDIALYKAKNSGRNRVVRFEKGMVQEESEVEVIPEEASLLSTK